MTEPRAIRAKKVTKEKKAIRVIKAMTGKAAVITVP